MKEFKINKFVSLRLEDNKTNIYINNQLFRQCKFLLINLDSNNMSRFEDIKSIDEAEKLLDQSLEERELEKFAILPEEEFWAHCSNLDAWVKHRYNTRLLHRSLAFPILQSLTEAGDQIAKAVFKEEIIKRFESGHPNVVRYLIRGDYIRKYAKNELLDAFLTSEEVSILKKLQILATTEVEIVEEIEIFSQYGNPRFAVEFDKKKLIGLELRCVGLKKFPLDVTRLVSLQKLFLDRNMLQSIPDEICQLKNLRELGLSGNHIETLPSEISSLKSLESFSLNVNNFKVFPEPIMELNDLKYLGLGMNKISNIPESIRNLRNLRILVLNHNQISKLPKSISNLKKLELLALDNNVLEVIPESIKKLTSLKELDLESNNLVSFPEFLFKINNLKKLNISNNRICGIPNLKKKINSLDAFAYDEKK